MQLIIVIKVCFIYSVLIVGLISVSADIQCWNIWILSAPQALIEVSPTDFESDFRPNLLGSNMGNYPWLADSWPTPNLSHNGKDSGKLEADRYYNGTSLKSSGVLLASSPCGAEYFFWLFTQRSASSITRTKWRSEARRPPTAPSTAPSTQRRPRTTCWLTTTPTPAPPTRWALIRTAATPFWPTVAWWVWSRIWTTGPSSLVTLGQSMPNFSTARRAKVRAGR